MKTQKPKNYQSILGMAALATVSATTVIASCYSTTSNVECGGGSGTISFSIPILPGVSIEVEECEYTESEGYANDIMDGGPYGNWRYDNEVCYYTQTVECDDWGTYTITNYDDVLGFYPTEVCYC